MPDILWSVVVPTYNRLPILQKCLAALEKQTIAQPYEILVIDDGSSDGTVEFLTVNQDHYPHLRLLTQDHAAAATARNYGIDSAKGKYIAFVDSDITVNPEYLQAHTETLAQGEKVYSYGRIIDTSNLEAPDSEPVSAVPYFTAAIFDTCNLAIARKWLLEAGKFDTGFFQYGWEDFELGMRVKKLGLKRVTCAGAIAFHYHAKFSIDKIPRLLDLEEQRGRMSIIFYQKHPTWEVRLMIQKTWLHLFFWGMLTLGGTLNDRTLKPLLIWLCDRGKSEVAMEIFRIYMNWYTVIWMYRNWDKESKLIFRQ